MPIENVSMVRGIDNEPLFLKFPNWYYNTCYTVMTIMTVTLTSDFTMHFLKKLVGPPLRSIVLSRFHLKIS